MRSFDEIFKFKWQKNKFSENPLNQASNVVRVKHEDEAPNLPNTSLKGLTQAKVLTNTKDSLVLSLSFKLRIPIIQTENTRLSKT